MHDWAAALHVALGAFCAVVAGASATYVSIYFLGVTDQINIDAVSPWHQPSLLHSSPLLNNTLLILIFCVSHSILSRQSVKDILSPLLPPIIFRPFFFLVSSLSLSLIIYGWTPLPGVLWSLSHPYLRYSMYIVSILGLVLLTVAFFTVQPLEFCGIQNSVDQLLRRTKREDKLVVTGIYKYIRHPMYSGLLICMWSQPTMSYGRLLVVFLFTMYLLVVVPSLEERDLIRLFGEPYKTYMKKTPMFLPLPSFKTNEKSE